MAKVEKDDGQNLTPMVRSEAENIIQSLASMFLEANSGAPKTRADALANEQRNRIATERWSKIDPRYQTFVEQIPAVIFMAFLDRGIGEAYVSPYIESLLGFSQEEWLNDPVRWYRQIHPDDKERWSLEAAHMLVSGDPLRSVYRVLARDGKIVWFQCEAKMVRDEGGRPWFIHGLAVDITELKETQAHLQEAHQEAQRRARELETANLELRSEIAEREKAEKGLRESEERFRLLVEGVKDYAIFLLDPKGYVVSWNQGAQRIKGYSADEILGEHFSKFYLPQDIQRQKPARGLKIAETEESYGEEGWRVRKNGEKFWANVLITALRDHTGRLYGFSKITRDMTEPRLVQEKLQESERLAAVGTTAAIFAHEIGNPLNGISTSLQLLKRQLGKQDANEGASLTLENVLKEVYHLGSLLDDFRALARPQNLGLQPTNIPQLVAALMAAEAAQCAERGIVVEQDLPPDLPMVLADSRRLKQALLNLCKNAIEAMTQGGTLTIRGRHFEGLLWLEITDTGVGIPADFDMFELFRTTKEHGTGLGLAIVRQIIAAHRGTISYQSQPGQGTTFTISLPLEPQRSS